MASPDWVAVLVAAVVGFLLGGLWYAPFAFGRIWVPLAYPGKTLDDLRAKGGGSPAIYGAAFVATLVAAATIGWFTESLGGGAAMGVRVGLYAAVGFVATSFATNYLFGGRPARLYAIDAGYQMLLLVAMGAVYGLWPW